MPFGLIYGALFFGLVCSWVGLRLAMLPWGPARAAGALMLVLGITMGLGLLLRQGWARWIGIAAALVLAATMLFNIAIGGPAPDVLLLVIFFAALTTAVLLILPATGDVRRGLEAGARRPRRAGRLLALTAVATLFGFLATAVWAWNAEPPRGGFRNAVWSGGPRVQWSDFGPGLEQAQLEDKLVFVDFYAQWCGPCRLMDRKTFRDPEVVELLGEVVPVRIDSEETVERHGYVGFDLAMKYQIESYPTVALLDAEGRMIDRRTGFQHPRQFIQWLRGAMEQAGEKKDLRFAAAGENPGRS